MDQTFVGSEESRQEANFYELLEISQHDNEHAAHLMNVKKSLDSKGKSFSSTMYKRMKMKVLKSLEADYLRRRAIYDEQGQNFKHVGCGQYLIPVEVPHPVNGFADPGFILLHQCMGGCRYKAPSVFHCAPKAVSTVPVNTYQVDLTTGLVEQKVVKMVRHVQCDSDCQCVVQEHHCNNATEMYNRDQCKCECKNLQHTCDAAIKEWDMTLCGCRCKSQPYPCMSNNKLWSPDTCNCQCLSEIKKRCIRKNKLLNKHTCTCYCSPDIVCPVGTELNQYDCSCVKV